MPSYGFKLLEIKLFRGRGQTALEFGGPDGKSTPSKSYLDLLVDDFAGRTREDAATPPAGAGTARDNGAVVEEVKLGSEDVVAQDAESGIPEEDEGNRELAVVRIKSAIRYQEAVLLDTVYGIVGDHALAIDPAGEREDTDLTRLATTRHYRALVIAPSSGKNGLLAVEVVSRSHAGSRLPSRLHAGARGHNFKIRTFGAVADEESVRNLMKGGRIREVNLYQTLPSTDSSQSKTIPAKITFSIGAGSAEEKSLKDRLTGWLPTKENKAKKQKPVAADEAKALATFLWPKIADTGKFETAEVVVEGTHRKRLKPLDMASGFTYDLGNVRPDDDTFVAHVADVVRGLAATNQVDLDDDWAVRVAN
ncbi:hypothetical protein DEI98_06720 [Curtobacterium sp. MCLR17_034]|nr:hypothetical protein DEI98_06720 [Curtobacterium sp. MCLR17_034]